MPVLPPARGAKRTFSLSRALWLAASITVVLSLRARPSAAGADEETCAAVVHRQPTQEQRLVYLKSKNMLCLVKDEHVVWSHQASHGSATGPKRSEGDHRTPEGRYRVLPARKSKRYVLFLPISYPNADDIKRARSAGRRAGSGVGIHGPQRWYAFLGQAQALVNHSDGCIVLDEAGIQELAARVTRPLEIEILADLPR